MLIDASASCDNAVADQLENIVLKWTTDCRIRSKSVDDLVSVESILDGELTKVRGTSCHHIRSILDRQKPVSVAPGGSRRFASVERLDVAAFCRTSSSAEGDPFASMSRYPPTTLDTVLENMPLVYNSATKRLERRQRLCRSDEPPQSASAVPLMSPSSDTTADMPASTSSLTKPFRKGHVRHSSYESAEIKLYPRGMVVSLQQQPRITSPPSSSDCSSSGAPSSHPTADKASTLPSNPPPANRTNSLHRTTDSLSSTVSIGSFYSEYSTSAASIETGAGTIDSAICVDGGSSSSKRSSLDRKSQCSSSQSFDQQSSDGGVTTYLRPGCASTCRRTTPGARSSLLVPTDEDKGKKKALVLPNISLPRNLFSRKATGAGTNAGGMGAPWKLFSASKSPSSTAASSSTNAATTSTYPATTVASTTALIINDRPPNLPAKSDAEAQKHRQQYEAMLDAAKKKEQREVKLRRKAQDQQRKLEEHVAAAARQWAEEILPKWDEMCNSRKCRDLWWQGLPPSVRGRVWSLVIGNDLSITRELYEICSLRAKDKLETIGEERLHERTNGAADKTAIETSQPLPQTAFYNDSGSPVINREGTVELIHLDVARTFPSLGIFQKGGPYYDLLLQLLGAYVCYRPDIGYVQSMSFVAAVLLLNMDSDRAFVAFANLLNRPLQLAFYRLRQPDMTNYFIAYDQYFGQELPKLHRHFDELDVPPDLYLIEWLYTLYAKSLPYDITCRVWDVYLRDGEEFLFKTALGILRTFESELLSMDFEQCVQFLSHLPQERVTSRDLFKNIEQFLRTPTGGGSERRRCFGQILADVSERLNPSPSSSTRTLGVNGDRQSAYSGHSRRISNGSAASATSGSQLSTANLKMSKSLSGFLGDLLNASAVEQQQLGT